MNSSYKSHISHKSHISYNIVFVGGGTSGHVNPNIAIIDELKKISDKNNIALNFLYIGRMFGDEKEIISSRDLRFKGILSGKLRRYFSWQNFSDIFLIFLGFIQSFFILLFNRPEIVFAKGGFVTVPFCLACYVLRVPFVIHESDCVIGLSNKILFPLAKKVFLGFPVEAYRELAIKKTFFTGNPVREEILNSKISKTEFCNKYKVSKNRKIILVSGGSQGAIAINNLVANSLEEVLSKYVLIHACGKYDFEKMNSLRNELDDARKKNYLLYSYIKKELGNFFYISDLVIGRGGASTIAEITAMRKPAIIIPLPSAAADHQNKNAKFLQRNNIFLVLDEGVLDAKSFFEELDSLISDEKKMKTMVNNMKNIFPENSSKIIAEELLKILEKK